MTDEVLMCLEKRPYHGVIYLVLTFIELRSLGEFCVLMELLGCKFTYLLLYIQI